MIKIGDEEIEAKFTNVDRKSRSVALSIKAKEVHEEAEALSQLQVRFCGFVHRVPRWVSCSRKSCLAEQNRKKTGPGLAVRAIFPL